MKYETNNVLGGDALKAVVYEKFGSPDVLEYREVEKPTVMQEKK